MKRRNEIVIRRERKLGRKYEQGSLKGYTGVLYTVAWVVND